MDISRRRLFGLRKPGHSPFRPPWSIAEAQFVERCTRCDDCIVACPTGLLVRGEGGFPHADFMRGKCTFCAECAKACVTGALEPGAAGAPWFFAVSMSDGCLAAQNVDCRICGEVCDVDAIRFRPRIGGVPLPVVDSMSCNGCGACIAPCPTGAVRRDKFIPEVEHV